MESIFFILLGWVLMDIIQSSFSRNPKYNPPPLKDMSAVLMGFKMLEG